jgi:hypothetical protein
MRKLFCQTCNKRKFQIGYGEIKTGIVDKIKPNYQKMEELRKIEEAESLKELDIFPATKRIWPTECSAASMFFLFNTI